MPLSATLTSAEGFQDYCLEFAPDLISNAFFGFKTADFATLHEGVKGKLVITELILDTLARKWVSTFDPKTGAADFNPRELNVVANKVDLSFTPQDFESNYLGQFRKKGQNPGMDLPFEGFIMNKMMEKLAQEIEVAVWQGAVPGSPTASDELKLTFDGFLELVKDLATGGHAEIAVGGGAYSTSNIVAELESMFDELNPALQDGEVNYFLSYKNYKLYNQAYRNDFSKYTDQTQNGRTKLDFGNAYLIPVPGMGTSDRVILTPASNLHIGFDDFNETKMFHFEQRKRQMDFWLDFKIGVQIGITDEDYLVINDLT